MNDMKRIPLTQGQFALVDDKDFEELSKYKWCADRNSCVKSFYAIRSVYATRSRRSISSHRKRRVKVYMHRIILDAPKGLQVDHINHDTLDNRKENLRLVTASQNRQNQRIRSNNTTGFKGVSFEQSVKKFYARIKVANKCIHIGPFLTPEAAYEAYKIAAIKNYGEFACF